MTDRAIHFRTELRQTGKNTTGIVVPPEIISRLAAGARPPVSVRVNGYAYRTTVGIMGGTSMLPFSADHRDRSGLKGGDPVDVELEIDLAPRTVVLPEDLDEALASIPQLKEAFLKQAPSRQKADVDNVVQAKTDETRARRIAAIASRLRA